METNLGHHRYKDEQLALHVVLHNLLGHFRTKFEPPKKVPIKGKGQKVVINTIKDADKDTKIY